MNMQVINRNKPSGGFRELTADEILMVSGGDGEEGGEGEDIVVTGRRLQEPRILSENTLLPASWLSGGTFNNPLIDLFAGFEGGGDLPPPPTVCQHSAASQAARDINNATAGDGLSGTRQPEYGITVVRDGSGNHILGTLIEGQSYRESDTPETRIVIPNGFSARDVAAVVHSHPPSGSSETDRQNRAPSHADWVAADRLVSRDANPNNLTLYIIDSRGVVRSYEYQTPAERGARASDARGSVDSSDGTIVDPNNPPPC